MPGHHRAEVHPLPTPARALPSGPTGPAARPSVHCPWKGFQTPNPPSFAQDHLCRDIKETFRALGRLTAVGAGGRIGEGSCSLAAAAAAAAAGAAPHPLGLVKDAECPAPPKTAESEPWAWPVWAAKCPGAGCSSRATTSAFCYSISAWVCLTFFITKSKHF